MSKNTVSDSLVYIWATFYLVNKFLSAFSTFNFRFVQNLV